MRISPLCKQKRPKARAIQATARRDNPARKRRGGVVEAAGPRQISSDVVREDCEKKKREARPFCGREPGFVNRELEPCAEQEKQNQRAEQRAEQSRFLEGKLLAQRFPVQGKEGDSKKQKKACEVIPFKQPERAQGIPETQQDDDEDRCRGKFEEHAGPGDGIR